MEEKRNGRERKKPRIPGQPCSHTGRPFVVSLAADGAEGVGGPSPPSTVSRDDARKKRMQTRMKRVLLVNAYNSAIADVNPEMAENPDTSVRRCWDHVCSHRYCDRNVQSPEVVTLIQHAARVWVEKMNQRYFAIPTLRHGRREDVERLVPPVQTPAPAVQIVLDPPAPPRVVHDVPPVMHGMILGMDPRFLKSLLPVTLNRIVQDMPPEMVERVFAMIADVDRVAVEKCPVCDEDAKAWSRLSRYCNHRMCVDCTVRWAKASASNDCRGCPICFRDNLPTLSCPVDPRSMFGVEMLGKDPGLHPFVSFQIPFLQSRLDAEVGRGDAPSTVCRCPVCLTVSTGGNNVIRRCHNPRCVGEYCMRCNCMIDVQEPYANHVDGRCVRIADDTVKLSSGDGMTACPRCNSRVWHATGHGCHSVKCPMCSLVFCHSCATPYDQDKKHTSKCSCPIFCKEGFACRCAGRCPECERSRCEHCHGGCDSCIKRESESGGGPPQRIN